MQKDIFLFCVKSWWQQAANNKEKKKKKKKKMPQKLNEFPCCGLHFKYFALIIDIKKCNKRKMNNIA